MPCDLCEQCHCGSPNSHRDEPWHQCYNCLQFVCDECLTEIFRLYPETSTGLADNGNTYVTACLQCYEDDINIQLLGIDEISGTD